MPSRALELARLSLSIERLIDAELLLTEEGEKLLEEIEAACHSLETSDFQGIEQHITQLLCDLRTLMRTDRLPAAEGQMAAEAAGCILNPPAD